MGVNVMLPWIVIVVAPVVLLASLTGSAIQIARQQSTQIKRMLTASSLLHQVHHASFCGTRLRLEGLRTSAASCRRPRFFPPLSCALSCFSWHVTCAQPPAWAFPSCFAIFTPGSMGSLHTLHVEDPNRDLMTR